MLEIDGCEELIESSRDLLMHIGCFDDYFVILAEEFLFVIH